MRASFVLLPSLVLMTAACGAAPPAVEIEHPPAVPPDAPSRGNARAPIAVQVFTDFQCPYCRDLLPTLARLEREYPDRVRIVYRSYPIQGHAHAELAAIAAVEVHEQRGDEAFWRYHDLLFEHQATLSVEWLAHHAQQIEGLDMEAFMRALWTREHRERIRLDMEDLAGLGLRVGTPATVIGRQLVIGAQPYSVFRDAVEAAR
jgi:protein-disulfide isomerase